MKTKLAAKSIAIASVLTLGLAACSGGSSNDGSSNGDSNTGTNSESTLKGTLNASGASSQVNAQQAWRDNFTKNTGVVVNYDPTGSGTGREQFIAGQVAFAGSDSYLEGEELAGATQRCGDTEPLELPLYISPIAIAFNLDGVKTLNLTAELIAQIFDGKIAKWNDPKIAALNEGVTLPDLDVIPVNRADDSGTSKNFQKYLVEAAGEAWPYEPEETWPRTGTQSAEKTSGVVNLVKSTPGAVTYADASQIGELGSAAVEVSGEYLPYSPEAAAKIVDGSAPTDDASDSRLTVKLKRDGSVAGAYPIVMVSYLIACTNYNNADDAANVKAFLSYVASAEGQSAAEQAGGGNAPISDELRTKVEAAIAKIQG